MTDEQMEKLAKVLRDAVADVSNEPAEKRADDRVRAIEQSQAERDRANHERLTVRAFAIQREQTAATVLAALIERGRAIATGRDETVREAVELADALRAELEKP